MGQTLSAYIQQEHRLGRLDDAEYALEVEIKKQLDELQRQLGDLYEEQGLPRPRPKPKVMGVSRA